MRKGIANGRAGTTEFSQAALDKLKNRGYKFVQVIGLGSDHHYDYTETDLLLLVPCKELPAEPGKKEIYEPIDSKLLYQWAMEPDQHPRMAIARPETVAG